MANAQDKDLQHSSSFPPALSERQLLERTNLSLRFRIVEQQRLARYRYERRHLLMPLGPALSSIPEDSEPSTPTLEALEQTNQELRVTLQRLQNTNSLRPSHAADVMRPQPIRVLPFVLAAAGGGENEAPLATPITDDEDESPPPESPVRRHTRSHTQALIATPPSHHPYRRDNGPRALR
jgi:hypothetical protein